MSKFNEVWKELHDENLKATKNKKHQNVSYSKAKEARLAQALLNTPDYETEVVRSKNGEFLHEKITPVADFRNQFVAKILKDNGVDKQQSEDAAKNYEFTVSQATAFNNMARENTEQFLRAGFTYDFGKKPDFAASIKMREIGERVVSGRVPATGAPTKTKEAPHKVIIKKSGTPKYCKTKLE